MPDNWAFLVHQHGKTLPNPLILRTYALKEVGYQVGASSLDPANQKKIVIIVSLFIQR
jgi:hypothetical protein